MNTTYYEILGVPQDASVEAIKRAYRARAMQCHPDHHRDLAGAEGLMTVINLAFEVLRDPALRRDYDASLARPHDAAAQQRAEQAEACARTAAASYPTKWEDFETWMRNDFQNMTYGKNQTPIFGWELPTAGSDTGAIFIAVGGIAGALSYLVFFNSVSGAYLIFRCLGFGFMGAWAGRWLHGLIGSAMKPSTQPPSLPVPPSVPRIVECPKCSKKIRPAELHKAVRITCGTCNHVFIHEPS